ncbi:MAG: thiamine-monophosphate kinase [Opitutales bacterium]
MPSPLTSNPADAFATFGEGRLLAALDDWLGADPQLLQPFGRSDDAAVFKSLIPEGFCAVQAADSLVYGLHFDDSAPAEATAGKLLRRNLSDFAAMGATPETALLTLFLGSGVSMKWLQAFFAGMRADCIRFSVTLAGGDVSGAPPGTFAASLFLSGWAERPLPRGLARTGDVLWVSGRLGGSLRGAHLNFMPRLAEGQWLARQRCITSAIDLSDGLASDLPKLIGTEAAARLDLNAIPLSEAARASASKSGKSPLEHAFTDGEDYELAFVSDGQADASRFAQAWRGEFDTELTCIGTVVSRDQTQAALLDAQGKPLPFAGGWEHR